MAVECSLCGCPFDDAYESEGTVVCECGIQADGVDPEDLDWGFHLVTIADCDDPEAFLHELIDEETDQW